MAARSNQVRIIAGQWRGRKLPFPDAQGLRPTADRIRETLFNWLTPVLHGAHCLDLFAGSGALGFEAASRGAAQVVMVDSARDVTAALQENAKRLSASTLQIRQQEAAAYLATGPGPFDVVFLDPPFNSPELLLQSIDGLSAPGRLAAGASIYIETPAASGEPVVPANWILEKQKKAGQVAYRLYRYTEAC
ncbi:MAG TPA: 16S rRNA (guanine(966)-N(2))-methyltransferase RsmD [Gammaproteobacteria bacterium]|nr:16S rRNA (guanine(966)-N(2))-methyltransferase RsmD [Gammaproteobacteria bacterium]